MQDENKIINQQQLLDDILNGPTPPTLEETIPFMISADYQNRFQAEYFQLKIRRNKLNKMLQNWNELPFTPKCSKQLLRRQLLAMDMYLDALEERAKIENVDISIDACMAMQLVHGSQDILEGKVYPVEEVFAQLKEKFGGD